MTYDVYDEARPEPTGVHDAESVLLVLAPEPWTRDALCAQIDPDMFFADGPGGTGSAEAKRVCAGCDVREQCLEYALRKGERFGVWGGLSPRQRQALTKRAAA